MDNKLPITRLSKFFGQDDFVTIENLNFCINLLREFDPDIIFANYTINRTWNYNNKSIFYLISLIKI